MIANSFLQCVERGEGGQDSPGEHCPRLDQRISEEERSPVPTTSTTAGVEEVQDTKPSRASLFPFLMPPFRGMYSQGGLPSSSQFDLLRNNSLIPYSGNEEHPAQICVESLLPAAGLNRTGQFPALHPFSLRGFPVHPSLLRQVWINPSDHYYHF